MITIKGVCNEADAERSFNAFTHISQNPHQVMMSKSTKSMKEMVLWNEKVVNACRFDL